MRQEFPPTRAPVATGLPVQLSSTLPNADVPETSVNRRRQEFDACGAGLIASKEGPARWVLEYALKGLRAVEHRGAVGADGRTSDGVGVMTSVPHACLGAPEGAGVGMFFLPSDESKVSEILTTITSILHHHELKVLPPRTVPQRPELLGALALRAKPNIVQLFIEKPLNLSVEQFESRLYRISRDIEQYFQHFPNRQASICSLSSKRIVYKALCTGDILAQFYPDLQDSRFTSSFALFHRRFSTNTATSWSRAQPLGLLAHNGEINTISGNRAAMHARERLLKLPKGALLTSTGLSDSGSLDQTLAALRFGALAPTITKHGEARALAQLLRVLIPPATQGRQALESSFEPWDGPALVTFSDGNVVGARLDRNGFRPFHFEETEGGIFGCSEAGAFELPAAKLVAKGLLRAGEEISVLLSEGLLHRDSPLIDVNEPVLLRLENREARGPRLSESDYKKLCATFALTKEEHDQILTPMALEGKEGLGSMGDTSRPAIFSSEPRAFSDFLLQSFAQVTNPPIDYLRERDVTDTRVFIGAPPLFETRKDARSVLIELATPLLTPEHLADVRELGHSVDSLTIREISALFDYQDGLALALERIVDQALDAARGGSHCIIISDVGASPEKLPVPMPLAVGLLHKRLVDEGLRPTCAIVVESAQVKSSHELAMLIASGARAVCPYLAFHAATRIAARNALPELQSKENLSKAFNDGLLKIISKMGISVMRSYEASQLFTPFGLGDSITTLLGWRRSPIGGVDLDHVARLCKSRAQCSAETGLIALKLHREDLRGIIGEKHSITQKSAKQLHAILAELRTTEPNLERAAMLYREHFNALETAEPIAPRHFWELRRASAENQAGPEERSKILSRFGSGAISYGAIGKYPQRDLIRGLSLIGGRSNSGEGGENPLYKTEGVTASTKQVASGHFGVGADYLNRDTREIQIKIGQGAKPGEGGQLMGSKVSAEIASARGAKPGQDLISPPPLHDIYSIEDLAQKIAELRAVNPQAKISVKLVSGSDIGSIAVGVAKCGADIIHIAGHDGGTGAAGLLSMKHTGLPWEVGLSEVHRALVEEGLREYVTLRVDGGLRCGKDLAIASILGADEFDFGKLLLIGEGCLMLRVCHTNKCSPGIATQDSKLETRYAEVAHDRGADIANLLRVIAEDARGILRELGVASLPALRGRYELISIRESHRELLGARKISFEQLLDAPESAKLGVSPVFFARTRPQLSAFESKLLGGEDAVLSIFNGNVLKVGPIRVTPQERAIGAWTSGVVAREIHRRHVNSLACRSANTLLHPAGFVRMSFKGSAGQAFGVFCREGVSLVLEGEANDSVGKSMSGGEIIITPPDESSLDRSKTPIIGNVALYGATGGTMLAYGVAGDRFAVRNSGADAVVEGAGTHACEYMTKGRVVILGTIGENAGAGMTGGTLFINRAQLASLNRKFVQEVQLEYSDTLWLTELLGRYAKITGSRAAFEALRGFTSRESQICKIEARSIS